MHLALSAAIAAAVIIKLLATEKRFTTFSLGPKSTLQLS
jgi:hypothetical protein